MKAAPTIGADLARNDLARVRLQEMHASGAAATLIWRILIKRQRLRRGSGDPLAVVPVMHEASPLVPAIAAAVTEIFRKRRRDSDGFEPPPADP
jgi:hypothetical protein